MVRTLQQNGVTGLTNINKETVFPSLRKTQFTPPISLNSRLYGYQNVGHFSLHREIVFIVTTLAKQ